MRIFRNAFLLFLLPLTLMGLSACENEGIGEDEGLYEQEEGLGAEEGFGEEEGL